MSVKRLARAIGKSENGKLGGASATYAGLQSCDVTCPLGQVCYAKKAFVGMTFRRITDMSASARETAIEEAAEIDLLNAKVPLRIHVSGDCKTAEAAEIVAASVGRWEGRTGQKAWAYTHSWAQVPRSAWGTVNVRASIESVDQIPLAKANGYTAFAIVQDTFEKETAYDVADGHKAVPCPEQTSKAASCVECGLCFKSNVSIVFRKH